MNNKVLIAIGVVATAVVLGGPAAPIPSHGPAKFYKAYSWPNTNELIGIAWRVGAIDSVHVFVCSSDEYIVDGVKVGRSAMIQHILDQWNSTLTNRVTP